MADVLVDGAIIANLGIRAVRYGPVWVNGSVGYLFFRDSSGDLNYRKTTDGGATWGALIEIEGAATTYAMDIWFDKWTPGDSGTKVHIFYVTFGDVRYVSFDTDGDSIGSSSVVADTVDVSTSRQLSGTKAVGGNLLCQFWVDSDGEHGFARSVDGGSSWAVRTDGADGNEVDDLAMFPDPASADPQDVCMIYWDRSANELSLKRYDDSANTWDETSIATSMVDVTTVRQLSGVLRHSDGHLLVVAWDTLADAGVTASLKCWDIDIGTPTVTAKTNVLTSVEDCICCGLFINQNNDALYCAYAGAEDGSEDTFAAVSVRYKKSTDGAATWDAETAYQEDAADDIRGIDVGHSSTDVLWRFEPAFYNDDLVDLYVNVNNAVSIQVANIAGALSSAGALGAFTFALTVAGTLTAAGTVLGRLNALLTGVLAPTGVVAGLVGSLVGGTLASAGTLTISLVLQTLAGTLTTTGSIATLLSRLVSGAGTLTTAGALTGRINAVMGGAITPTAVLIDALSQTVTGVLTMAGTTTQTILHVAAGTLTSAGAVSFVISRIADLAGALTTAGSHAGRISASYAGALAQAGTLGIALTANLAGTLTSSGAIIALRNLLASAAGALTPTGTLALAINRIATLAGTLTLTGLASAGFSPMEAFGRLRGLILDRVGTRKGQVL